MGVPFVQEVRSESESLPCFGFEGFEKRLEVQFSPAPASVDPKGVGLRAMPRGEIDGMLKAAECTIVSQWSTDQVDSYVLSESSLFVQPALIVLKTCGTTQLLQVLPLLLESAGRLQMEPLAAKYTRGSFIFPEAQPFPHNSFTEEVKYLENFFGHLGAGGKSFILGDDSVAHKWHIYYAAAEDIVFPSQHQQSFTLEVCMSELDQGKASLFEKSCHASGKEMTEASGINLLLPGSQICDFAFDPCGYSMNGLSRGATGGAQHSTIHVTPEAGFSYASFEAMGYGPQDTDLQGLVDRVALVFKPEVFSVALFAGGGGQDITRSSWSASVRPRGYSCSGTSREVFGDGSVVVYHTYKRATARTTSGGTVEPLPLFQQQPRAADGDFVTCKGSSNKGGLIKAEAESERLCLPPCASALQRATRSDLCCLPINRVVV